MFRPNSAEDRRTDIRLSDLRLKASGDVERELMLSLGLSNLDVGTDFPRRFLVDDWPDIGRWIRRIAHHQRARRADEPMQERIVRASNNNHSAACGALLSAETKRALSHAQHRFVEVGRCVDDDRILAAHFANDFLHEFLPRRDDAGCLHDVETDRLGARERDDRHQWIAHQRRADRLAGASEEVEHILRSA